MEPLLPLLPLELLLLSEPPTSQALTITLVTNKADIKKIFVDNCIRNPGKIANGKDSVLCLLVTPTLYLAQGIDLCRLRIIYSVSDSTNSKIL